MCEVGDTYEGEAMKCFRKVSLFIFISCISMLTILNLLLIYALHVLRKMPPRKANRIRNGNNNSNN